MALGYYFSPKAMSADKYDEVIRRLEAAGQGSPPGRTHHIAFDEQGTIHVFDVWDSQESFDAFGETLMPILGDLGIDPGEPHIAPIHNIIEGS